MSEHEFKKGDVVVAKPEYCDHSVMRPAPWATVRWVVISVNGDMFRAKVEAFPGHKESHFTKYFMKLTEHS